MCFSENPRDADIRGEVICERHAHKSYQYRDQKVVATGWWMEYGRMAVYDRMEGSDWKCRFDLRVNQNGLGAVQLIWKEISFICSMFQG